MAASEFISFNVTSSDIHARLTMCFDSTNTWAYSASITHNGVPVAHFSGGHLELPRVMAATLYFLNSDIGINLKDVSKVMDWLQDHDIRVERAVAANPLRDRTPSGRERKLAACYAEDEVLWQEYIDPDGTTAFAETPLAEKIELALEVIVANRQTIGPA